MFNIVGQLIDFLFKAVVAYRQTPEGEKEWQDVTRALSEVKTLVG
jgi:hypothetical protein